MEVVKSLYFRQPILYLRGLENDFLGSVDSYNSVRVIDTNSYKVVDGFKTNILREMYYTNSIDMTFNAEYIVSTIPHSSEVALFSLSKKEPLYKVSRHNAQIESVGIDPAGRYFVTCGQDGKSYAWVLETSRLAFSLPNHSDFVSVVAFSKNSQYIATGSYDHTIHLLDIATLNKHIKFKAHASAIIGIVFLSYTKILSVDRDGGVIVWDIATQKVIKRLESMKDEVTCVCVSSDDRFVFIGTKLGYIGLYNTETMEQISHKYIKLTGSITSLATIDNPLRLAVATTDGFLYIYNLFGDEEHLTESLKNQNYKDIYNELDKNPMLYYSKIYEALEYIWEKTIARAERLLQRNRAKDAQAAFTPFFDVPKKAQIINQIFKSYEKYDQFMKFVKEQKLQLAYNMIKQYPAFVHTEPYRQMEERWKKLFFKAQELILTPNGDEKAKELLAPYRGISEKTALIQQLFNSRKIYLYLKKTLSQKDYIKFFALIKQYPFLKEFPEYNQLKEYSDNLYKKTLEAFEKNEFLIARKLCDELLLFPKYSVVAEELRETIRIRYLFTEAISSKNISDAYYYLSLYPLLQNIPEAIWLEKEWAKTVDLAQKYAAKGDVDNTFRVFKPYFAVKVKFTAMGSVMAQAYCAKLEMMVSKQLDSSKVIQSIKHYIAIFGEDDSIMGVIDLFRRLYGVKIDLEHLRKGSLDAWNPQMFIEIE